MHIKNNYNECLTNIACSIRKYFNLEYHHETIKEIDEKLKNKPKNVILILLDGMGYNILNRTLTEESFFRKNLVKRLTSVFPATTTAATTSIRTGLDPIEHGWLGWNTYIKTIDQVITLFIGCDKITKEKSLGYEKMLPSFQVKTIGQELDNGVELFPFPTQDAIVYQDMDDMCNKIYQESLKPGLRFIYAYNDEPDHTMHDLGPDNAKVKQLIKERNTKIERLCEKLDDSLVIIVADHGHIKTDHLFLNEYPNIKKMMERDTSLEQRAISFKIKDEYIDEFPTEFNKTFGKWFKLYSRDEIINSHLFGYGKMHPLFKDAIGDFIAIAEDSNKTITSLGDEVLYSQHAGYTDDEVYIPLIMIDKTKKVD